MRLKDMRVSSLLKGCIYEVSFGYNPKMEGYATLMSDIPELYEMADRKFNKEES
ncbi:MAG: hypothetical protein WA977_00220 [Halobacteriota archaeon]